MQWVRAQLVIFFLLSALLLVMSCSKPLGSEPLYKGRPLSYWAMMTQDQDLDSQPSDQAIEAIEAVRAIGPAAIPYLLKWIQPPWSDSRLPDGAVQSFKALGSQAASAIPKLAAILNQRAASIDDESSKSSAAEALAYLGPEAIPVLLAAATNLHGQHIQWEIIEDLGRFGTNGVAAIPALIEWSRDKDEWVRLGAINALGEINLQPEAVIPVLLAALKDLDALVRRDAAEALGNFGKDAKAAVPALIKALDDPDWQAQTGAIGGLGKIGEQTDIVFPLLVKKLHDENGTVRRCAAFALGDIGGQAAFNALLQATDDPDGFVREAVFQSLKRIDPAALEKSGKRFY
jgi:HEAT repeat protein